jgi:chemotaxis protein histidine kinase CheA
MLELFGAEVDMHLPALSEGLLAMEKGRSDKQEIESMMRAAHSIKALRESSATTGRCA